MTTKWKGYVRAQRATGTHIGQERARMAIVCVWGNEPVKDGAKEYVAQSMGYHLYMTCPPQVGKTLAGMEVRHYKRVKAAGALLIPNMFPPKLP